MAYLDTDPSMDGGVDAGEALRVAFDSLPDDRVIEAMRAQGVGIDAAHCDIQGLLTLALDILLRM